MGDIHQGTLGCDRRHGFPHRRGSDLAWTGSLPRAVHDRYSEQEHSEVARSQSEPQSEWANATRKRPVRVELLLVAMTITQRNTYNAAPAPQGKAIDISPAKKSTPDDWPHQISRCIPHLADNSSYIRNHQEPLNSKLQSSCPRPPMYRRKHFAQSIPLTGLLQL